MIDVQNMTALLKEPDDWRWGELSNKDGQKIRYGWNAPENPKALVIIAEGRTEVIEEYFETIRDLNAAGFACAIMDWQGQGLSYRYHDDNSRQHSDDFTLDIVDFTCFMNTVEEIGDISYLPRVMLAHSMGANYVMHYIAANPGMFKCAVFSAPMFGLNPKLVIKHASSAILKAASRFKWMKKHAFGQSAWSEIIANIAKYKVSSDPVRRELQPYLFKKKPEYRCGGVTFGWVEQTLKSIKRLHDPDFCKTITTPIIIAVAGKDIVVDNDGSYKIADLLPHAEIHLYKDAQHQIHRERDAIRDKFMKAFEEFCNSHLS